MKRIAALDGGTFYHRRTLMEPPFAHHFTSVHYAAELPADALARADVVYVPSRLDARLLEPLAPVLVRFMRKGGTLVVMGETAPDRWLEDIRTTPLATNYWWWLEPEADLGLRIAAPEHPLFRYLDRAAFTWHLHGWFHPRPAQRPLVTTAEGQAILIEDCTSHAPGRLIATTLDPCYHHGSFFMPATTRFLGGFLGWLANEP